MTKNATFNLDLSLLNGALSAFAEKEGLDIEQTTSPNKIKLVINANEDKETNGYLTIFLKSDGCSFLAQGKLMDVCNNLKSYIIRQTLMPDDDRNVSVTFKNVPIDVFNLLEPAISQFPNVNIKEWDSTTDPNVNNTIYVQ